MNAGRLGLLSVGLMLSLTACDLLGGGGPSITSFTATPSTIMVGSSSVLAWTVDSGATKISISGGSPVIGDVTGDVSTTVTPTTTTTYTLTAESADGTSTKTAVVTVSDGTGGGSGGPGPIEPDPDSLPEGTFGVSTSATGTFSSDQTGEGNITNDADGRIISVAAGSTFYAQVDYSDPDGIASIVINLVNSSPEGLRKPLPSGGFTAGEPTSCDLGSNPTEVTCVYPITVDAGTVDISELEGAGSEFAYVFRANVTDTLGNSVLGNARGYVNIQ